MDPIPSVDTFQKEVLYKTLLYHLVHQYWKEGFIPEIDRIREKYEGLFQQRFGFKPGNVSWYTNLLTQELRDFTSEGGSGQPIEFHYIIDKMPEKPGKDASSEEHRQWQNLCNQIRQLVEQYMLEIQEAFGKLARNLAQRACLLESKEVDPTEPSQFSEEAAALGRGYDIPLVTETMVRDGQNLRKISTLWGINWNKNNRP